MKQLDNFIQEKLKLNKDYKEPQTNVLKTILNVIKSKSEEVEKYLKEWIQKEKIQEVEIYIQYTDYWKTLKNNNNDTDLIKMYTDVNNKKSAIDRTVYNNTRKHWIFIGEHEGLGYWQNYFGYSSSERDGRFFKFSSPVYIKGIEK